MQNLQIHCRREVGLGFNRWPMSPLQNILSAAVENTQPCLSHGFSTHREERLANVFGLVPSQDVSLQTSFGLDASSYKICMFVTMHSFLVYAIHDDAVVS